MEFSENVKSGLSLAADAISDVATAIAEKNRLRIQLNHIKKLIKTDSATRDQAYIELGRFYYEHLREGAPAENEAICAVIDAASDRISSASLKYMELLNLQNETKLSSENTEKLKKIIAEKADIAAKAAKDKGAEIGKKAKDLAAQGAQKAKEAAANLKDKADDTVEEVKERFDPDRNAEIEQLIAEEQAKIEEAPAPAAEAPAVNEESPEDFSF